MGIMNVYTTKIGFYIVINMINFNNVFNVNGIKILIIRVYSTKMMIKGIL